MKRVGGSRHDYIGMFRHRPRLDPMLDVTLAPVSLRRMDEVRQLLELVDRGLLSEEEFDRQVQKVYGITPAP